jgi:very-short-patch-repair endonuclease/predicted transcriptional regulator of viral defense system
MRGKLHAGGADGDECAVIDADRTIAAIAGRQRGLVTRTPLLAAGIDSRAIERRLRAGRLHAVHRGIYLVGHPVMPGGARELAALMACGRGAVVSHLSAANLHRLLPYRAQSGPVDITVVGRQVARRPGIRIHRVRSLDRRDVRTIDRIAITTPARTVLDLAVVVSTSQLERALAEAQVRRLTTRAALLDQLERNRGRAGTRALRTLVEVSGGPAPTRSEAERRLLRLVGAAGLPRPLVNTRVGRLEVDFMWSAQRLVVEVDGFRYHSSRASFESDRQRDAQLAASGYTVVRVTWRQLVNEPEAVVARLATALAVRGFGRVAGKLAE